MSVEPRFRNVIPYVGSNVVSESNPLPVTNVNAEELSAQQLAVLRLLLDKFPLGLSSNNVGELRCTIGTIGASYVYNYPYAIFNTSGYAQVVDMPQYTQIAEQIQRGRINFV